jgi:hypothetical protein
MKRAYLFGAAALLILLIVVAYVSYSRKTKGDVCVRPPPQVVGPVDPVARALVETFNEEGDEEEVPLVLKRPKQKQDSPIGGPVPVDPVLQSDPCEAACRPRARRTPYTPKSRPDFGDSPVVSLDRLSELKERQRQRTNEWAADMRAKTLQTPTPPRRLQTPDSTQSPLLPRLRGEDRSPTPSNTEFCEFEKNHYYPAPFETPSPV